MSLELVAEMVKRAREAGDASGIYMSTHGVVMGPDGPTEPVQIVALYAVGERAFLPDVDVVALERRRAEDALLERALTPSIDELIQEAEDGALGDLGRDGA